MRDGGSVVAGRRAFVGLALWALVLGLFSAGQGVWHLVVRDELWGLGLAVRGALGAVMLWLSHRFWRAAERRRPGPGPEPG